MSKTVSAFRDDALGTMDGVGIASAIASGKVSATECVEAAIARAELVNEKLGAIAFKTYDRAKAQAATFKVNGSIIGGVPTFIKDNEMMKGVPTQFGTGAFRSKPAKKNGRFVDQYMSTGLNPLGKTTLPEFGFICSAENPGWGITRNPWNTDYTTGGSSSGSAAMVASGVVPIALANDGAGSIRIPASCCGLVGFKSTRGRLIDAEGTGSLPINIIHEGVLTRSVRDTAAFFAAAESHFRNPALPTLGYVQQPVQKRLKVLFFDNIPEGRLGHQDADTSATLQHTARLLESLGHHVEQQPFPFDIELIGSHFLNYYGMLAFAIKNFGGLFLDSKPDKKKLETFTLGLSRGFRRNIFSIGRSVKKLREHGASVEKLFDNYDIVITPVLAHSVPPIGYFSIELPYDEILQRVLAFASFAGLQNVTGSPAISLPMGTDHRGLPLGLHFCAPFGQDKLLLELAYELEAAQPFKMIYA